MQFSFLLRQNLKYYIAYRWKRESSITYMRNSSRWTPQDPTDPSPDFDRYFRYFCTKSNKMAYCLQIAYDPSPAIKNNLYNSSIDQKYWGTYAVIDLVRTGWVNNCSK